MKIMTITEFIDWTEALKGSFMLYRGLSDSSMELEASGYRRIKQEKNDAAKSVFYNYITWLLDRASRQGFRQKQGKNLSDLELLAELQHNGAATCLMDFTANPLIALWFACKESPEKNGKVAAMATDNPDYFSIVDYKSMSKTIMEFFKEDKLWKWAPAPQNNRIVAQNSVFVFGKEKIAKEYYEIIEIQKGNKDRIIKELQDKFGIDEEYLFSDFSGFSLANAHDKSYSDYSVEDYFSFGLESSQRAEYEKAIEYYSIVLELNPKSAEAYNNRGVAKNASRDHQGAIADYDKAIELNPRYAEVYNNRGVARSDLSDHQGAITDYDKAIAINPQFAKAYNNRGVAKRDLDDPQSAIEYFDKAIELNSQFSEAYNNRGIARSSRRDYQGAIADYNKAIALNPQYAEAYNSRGITRMSSGDPQSAIADYDKAIALNPKHAKAYNNRGNAKRALNDHPGAIADCDKAIELGL